jgi:hypothetical protein
MRKGSERVRTINAWRSTVSKRRGSFVDKTLVYFLHISYQVKPSSVLYEPQLIEAPHTSVVERAGKGNACDMGETAARCARDGLSGSTVELLISGAITFGVFGVTGVPLDEEILPMYHDYNQNGQGYDSAQSVNMNITFLEYELTGTQPRSPSSSFTIYEKK